MDLLEPGCEGVIKNVAKVPLKNYKQAFEFVVDAGNNYYAEEMDSLHGGWEEDYSDPDMEEFNGYSEEWRRDDSGRGSEGGGDYELPSQHKKDEL